MLLLLLLVVRLLEVDLLLYYFRLNQAPLVRQLLLLQLSVQVVCVDLVKHVAVLVLVGVCVLLLLLLLLLLLFLLLLLHKLIMLLLLPRDDPLLRFKA